MCHEFGRRAWNREPEPEEEADETPEFLNEDAPEDVELLTDGGDE